MNGWVRRHPMALFYLFFGITIGVLFGTFTGSQLMTDQSLGVIAKPVDPTFYLFEGGRYSQALDAEWALRERQQGGIDGVIVEEYNQYVLYHLIALHPSAFSELIDRFDEEGWDYNVRTIVLGDYVRNMGIHTDGIDAVFFTQSIDYFYHFLRGEKVPFSSDYQELVHPGNETIYHHLVLLGHSNQEAMRIRYALYVYQAFADVLM